MRVLHAAYSSDPAAGVTRQMAAEQAAGERLGIDWTARYFVPSGTDGAICVQSTSAVENRLAFKREFYQWLTEATRQYDVLLLRYLRYDPLQLRFIARTDKPVFLVHHTLEGPQILQEGGRGARFKFWLDEHLLRLCHARAAGLIAVTDEISAYERARGARSSLTYLYPNGITYEALPVDAVIGSDRPPEMLFVASRFVEWHGLDLLIDAARLSGARFSVHVVGKLLEEQHAALAEDARFIVHGTLSIAEVEALAARCTIGLGSFALHRKDMHQACTLKVREYLLAGLPVFAGHVDVFDRSMRWYRHGECEIEAILAFAQECVGASRRQVADEARPWIDKEQLLQRLHAFLLEHVSESNGPRT